MHIQLTPDRELRSEKQLIGRVPTLILRPVDGPRSSVGLLWIHGGGYMTGMKEMVYMTRGADFVKRYGVTVFSPGYRLAWQKPYPAAVEDCFTILDHMNRKRDALEIDRLMVGGESAGGGLCAAVCMMARDRGIHVAFQMPLYPMLSNLDTESSRNNHGRGWNTRKNHLGWKMYLRKNVRGNVSPYAAPSRQTDYGNLPPCYTFVGDGEPFYSETLAFVDSLKAAGVEAVADVYHTDLHAFDIMRPEDEMSREAVRKLYERFEYAMQHYR